MSSDVLVFVEQRAGAIKKASFEALTLGRELASGLGGSVNAAVIGSGIAGLASEIAAYGAEKVFTVDHADLELYTGDGYATALSTIVSDTGPRLVLMAHTALGKDLGPRAAALAEAGMVTDVTAVEVADGSVLVTKPVYAGKAYKKVRADAAPAFISLRPNATPASESAGAGETVSVDGPSGPFLSVVKEIMAASTDSVPLQEASVIVAAGRGLKGPENWKLIEDLAAAFGPGVAAIGASRAVVDAGWRPHAEQVGQTGKVVAPTLYIAVGISGAIQHLAGMSTSKYIVAINKDADAPIFKVANYGIVGDAFEVVPALTEAIKAAVH